MKINRFEDIKIWKLSLLIIKYIYDLTSKKEFVDFYLKDQMRRAGVSVASNIVEGFEKSNNNEFIRYLKIAKGSSGELRSQLYIAKEIKYIKDYEFNKLLDLLLNLSRQIGGFINYLQIKKRNKEFTLK